MADTLLGGIAINEILVDPNGANNFDTDGNGTADARDEFVELVNTSNSAIDISGLQLWDAGNDNWFTFPPGTILQSGAHAMVITGVQPGGALPTGGPGDLFFNAGRGTAVLNNGGDNVIVYDPGANEYIAAQYNGAAPDDPTAGGTDYVGFPSTATQSGTGDNFGNDNDGFSIQRAPDGSDTFVNDQTPTPGTGNICFTSGTLLDTPTGPRLIEVLCPGDLLLTRDNGAQRIKWIWSRCRSSKEITQNPRLAPVLIRQGALGQGLPQRDLRLSQQHRVLVASRIAGRVFGAPEVLAPAKALIGLPGVELCHEGADVTYFHILLDSHEVLSAEGLPAESLYLGPQALRMLDPEALCELAEILGPEVLAQPPRAVRPFARGRKLRQLLQRHARNAQPLMQIPGFKLRHL